MNEHYFDVTFTDEHGNTCYEYYEHGALPDVMAFARTMCDSTMIATVSLNGKPVVSWRHDENDVIYDKQSYFELTHWEVNASWLYRGVGDDDNYGEFRTIGMYDNENDAIDEVHWLVSNCKDLIVDDIALFDADAITLDVRPAGPNCFEYTVEITSDGKVA